jgi:hypothetical protein
VKTIQSSKNKHLWVIAMGLVMIPLQYSNAQDVDKVKVYDVISNQNICFGESFSIDTINILEDVDTAFGNTEITKMELKTNSLSRLCTRPKGLIKL